MISWIWLLQTFKQTPFAQLLPPKKLFVHFPKVTWLWMWTGCNISGERGQEDGKVGRGRKKTRSEKRASLSWSLKSSLGPTRSCNLLIQTTPSLDHKNQQWEFYHWFFQSRFWYVWSRWHGLIKWKSGHRRQDWRDSVERMRLANVLTRDWPTSRRSFDHFIEGMNELKLRRAHLWLARKRLQRDLFQTFSLFPSYQMGIGNN